MPGNGFTNNHGLSLLELLITLAVMIILITSAAPSYLNWYHQTRLKYVAREVTLLLLRAQHLAVTRHETTYVQFNHDNNARIDIVTEHCLQKGICPTPATQDYLLVSPPVTLTSATFSAEGQYTRFSASTGLADGGAGSIILKAGPYQLKVIINRLGRVRTCAIGKTAGEISQC